MARSTIAIGLDAGEKDAVIAQLSAAEFGTVALERPEDLGPVVKAGLPIGLAILQASDNPAELPGILAELRADGINVPALIVADASQLDGLLDDHEFGPDDEFAIRPVDAEAIRWHAEAMLIRSQVSAGPETGGLMSRGPIEASWASRSPIIAIFNPKGGVGKTTIATNLASALQGRRDRQVLLVDADTVTGHVTMSLGMDSGRTLVDAWQDEDDGGPAEGLLDIASTHDSGIRVAALVSSPLSMPNISPDRVEEALAAARWGVDAIVVDLHPSYSEVNQRIFSIADRVIVPVTPDLPAIRAATQLCAVADELGIRDRLALVVNRAKSGVSVEQIEQAVGLTSIASIRSGGMLFVRAANEGRTVLDMFPKDPVSKDFEDLADRILGLNQETPAAVNAGRAATSLLSGLLNRKQVIRT
ncbi:MAG: AAA family ATPase [Chloroflexota bacterium]